VSALGRKLLRDVWRLRSQVLTTALVVAGGVGGFVGSLSAHACLLELRDRYYESARFAHVFVALRRAPQGLEASLRSIPGVVDVQTGVTGNVIVSLPGARDGITGRVIALPERGVWRMNRVVLRSGRPLEPDDERGILVGEGFATARRISPGDSLSLLMNGKMETFFVRGIAGSPEFIFSASHGGFADDRHFGVFWIASPRLAAAYDMRDAFNTASLRIARGVSTRAVIDAVDRILVPFGGMGAYDRDSQLSHRTLTREIEEQRVYAVVFPAVFFGVAVFLLNVLLGRHIATERSQIASLKALGYGNAAIGAHYLQFVAAIVAVGLALGIGVGYLFGRWMTSLFTAFFHFPSPEYRLAAWIPFAAAAATFVAALGATFAAIRRVVKLPPAEAMRPPSPAVFRSTLLDRLGFSGGYSQQVRMVVRELERRPARALVTTLGISGAIAILIAGTWWGDAIDFLVRQEFNVRDRADITIALTEASEPAVLHAVSRLPGVLEAEGSHDIPVELRDGSRRLRVNVMGVDAGSHLHRLLDERGEPFVVPESALVLSTMTAQRLEVSTGARVWLDPLVGSEPARWVTVVAAAGDLMGSQAYTSRRIAARLAGESDTYTTLRLRVDPGRRAALFAALREIPAVAAIGDKVAMLDQFRRTSARNLLAFTGILSIFAAAIAVGVVYNTARIALAEHAWELATLRVLGCRRGEVSGILLGQLAAQMVLAIPLGCGLGYLLSALIVTLIRTEDFRIPLIILPPTYALATLVTIVAGVLSALVVRRRIDALDLVAVLKTRE